MSKFGRSIDAYVTEDVASIDKPWKAKRRNLRTVAPNDDDSAPEKSQESPESKNSESSGLVNPMTSTTSRQSSRFLAEFQTSVVGCRQDVSKLILEKIRDIEQQAASQEAAYISAATENLAGQDLSKTTKDELSPGQRVSEISLSSASKLIEEYETFCEETTSITSSKETFADWDDDYRRLAILFSRQRNITRDRIGAYLDKEFDSSKKSPSRGGHLAPDEPVWEDFVEFMQIPDEDSFEDNWAVAISRAERGVQNLVKVLRDET